jgi:hypothetical protein
VEDLKDLWVETDGDPLDVVPTTSESVDERFFGCPVWWLQRVLPVVKSPHQLVVAIYLWRRRVVCGNHKTFGVPNSELKSWGISRYAKYRTLKQLASAGIIKASFRGKEASGVTILVKQPRSERQ